jgi:hypothetical protein
VEKAVKEVWQLLKKLKKVTIAQRAKICPFCSPWFVPLGLSTFTVSEKQTMSQILHHLELIGRFTQQIFFTVIFSPVEQIRAG